jgi:hypothetical protein
VQGAPPRDMKLGYLTMLMVEEVLPRVNRALGET